ncbi:MAG: YqaJ viral recombinase family protein [Nitrosomonadales bacterium]|nr:YqaJ viral recombinase family protein [Nitrosomonadales bacterium]
MKALMKMVQGSPEWHAHRAQYRNASETAAVCGASPWMTPYELWLVKTGRKVVEENAAMRHGTQMEPAARAAFEEVSGLIMQPQVVVDGLYSASLDGITLGGDTLLEIKCPFKGAVSELWQSVKSGTVPEHYQLQVQHQLMVTGARQAYLWVYDGNVGIKNLIQPDEIIFARIRECWELFQPFLDGDTPPPLTDQDTCIRTDHKWQTAAEEYRGWKSVADEASAKADAAKAKLVELTKHSRESGFGVAVTRYWKAGNVDYKKVVELQGVDLEQYRGKMREEVRVSVA